MISDGQLTPSAARDILGMLRNRSHEDQDDEYLEPCPYCGGKQVYDRSVPRAGRPIMCTNLINCPGPTDDEIAEPLAPGKW